MKPKIPIICHYRINFESAWLVRGTSNQQGGVDAGYLTDFLGRPYIPGSTMKGKIRDAFNRLLSIRPEWASYRDFLFGSAGQNTGQVYFHDGLLDAEQVGDADLSEIYTRVSMDRYRKMVKDTAVITERTVKPFLPLQGTIETYVQEEDLESIGLILLLCLLDMKSIGSGASIGRGKVAMSYGTPPEKGRAAGETSYCWLETKQNDQSVIWDLEHLESLIQSETERQVSAR